MINNGAYFLYLLTLNFDQTSQAICKSLVYIELIKVFKEIMIF